MKSEEKKEALASVPLLVANRERGYVHSARFTRPSLP